jgi:predicted small metal-binding protein
MRNPKVFPISTQGFDNGVRLYYGLSGTPATNKGVVMQKVINCPCGFTVRAESDDQLVTKAQEHAKQVHQMDLTREQALAMARPE